MGSPDGTKIALGLLASTSALIFSYILLKKYGFRASRATLDKREAEELQDQSEKEPNLPSSEYEDVGSHDELGQGELQDKSESTTCDAAAVEDGQNQASFIVLGESQGNAPPEGGDGVKKSDKSSDESSYDVIEDDRMVDTEEDEDERTDANASARDPVAERSAGDRLDLESSLEASIVMVEEAEPSMIEKSGSSFYASADEHFGTGQLEGDSKPEEESEKADAEVMELSVTEDETTVVYKSASAGNDSLSLGGKDSVNDVTPVAEEFVVAGEGGSLESARKPSTDDPDVQTKLQNLAITDAVMRADLEAASTGKTQEVPPEAEKDMDFTQVTEMLNKCQNSPMNVSKEDIHLLVQLLRRNLPELQATVLNCIVRIAAFNQNTTNLRDCGCPEEIVYQLRSNCEEVMGGETGAEAILTSINQVITNLSMDPKAHPKLEESIPSLISLLLLDAPHESLVLSTLRPLINLSAEPTYHAYYVRAIPVMLGLLDSGATMVKVQSLKILVNLSLNEDMVPHMLAAKAPLCLMDLLEAPTQNDVILRTVTMLANVFTMLRDNPLDVEALPVGRKTDLSASMFTALSGEENLLNLRGKVFCLTKHDDEDICYQASRLHKNITASSG